jgi:hypothetical protein
MTSDEVGAVVLVALFSAMLVIALKLLGIRRVLLLFVAIALMCLALALKSLAVLASSRR